MSTTINGSELTSLISGTVNLSSQDADTCTLQLSGVVSGYAPGSGISIVCGGKTVFVGKMRLGPKYIMTGSSYNTELMAEGYFSALKNIIYETNETSATWPLAGSFGSKATTKFSFSGQTIAAIMNTLQAYAQSSGQFPGTFASSNLPSTIIPKLEGSNASVASIMRTLVNYTNGGMIYQSGGTIQSMMPSSAPAISLDSATILRQWTLNNSSVISFVRLNYWRETYQDILYTTATGGTVTPTRLAGRLWVSQDTAGSSYGGGLGYVSDIMLGGVVNQKKTVFTTPSDFATLNKWLTWKSGSSNRYIYGDLLRGCGVGCTPVWHVSDFTHYAPRADRPWMRSWICRDTNGTTVSDTASWYPILTRDWKVPAEILNQAIDGGAYTWGERCVESNWAETDGGTADYSRSDNFIVIKRNDGQTMSSRELIVVKESISGVLESAPSGAASSIYNAFRSGFYEGQITMGIAEWNGYWAVEIGGVRSPCQTISIDLKAEKVTMNFGPPTQIRPDDILAGLRRKLT